MLDEKSFSLGLEWDDSHNKQIYLTSLSQVWS
jgi:hypothetical protein